MGLDITAIKNATFVRMHDDGEDDWYDEGLYRVRANSDFPGRESPLVADGLYSYTESMRCLGLSYIGYSIWRDRLAKLAGYPAVETEGPFHRVEPRHDAGCRDAGAGPFYELIWFSDCKGSIGTEACKKLLVDFDKWDELASSSCGDVDWFYRVYRKLHDGVRLAADGGFLDFG